MAGPTKAQLEAQLRELEAENARLLELEAENSRLRDEAETARRQAPAASDVSPGGADEVRGDRATSTRTGTRVQALLATLLIVVGTLLAPIATVAAFAARQVSDTDAFVSTLAPLADDPEVQQFVIDEAAVAIDDALDTDQLVADLLASVIDAEATPRLANASEMLGPLLADQARTAIRSALTTVVESESFSTVWEEALRLTHAQMTGVLEGDGDGAVVIDDAGVVVIELEPIIAQLKPALVDAGFSLAASIPTVDVSIVVAEIPQVATARLAYSVLTTVGAVLPWVAIGLVVVGVAGHPRSSRAVVIAGSILLVEGALLGGSIAIGGSVTAALIATQVPTGATAAVYGALTAEIQAVMVAYVVIGLVAIVAGFLSGRSLVAYRFRDSGGRRLGRSSAWLDARGWRPEGLPSVLQRHGWLLWLWLGVIFVILAATLPPLTAWDIVIAALVLGIAALLFALLRGVEGGADQVDGDDAASRTASAGEGGSPGTDTAAQDRDPAASI